MNALVIARRELAEKRFIFFTAIALTLLPIVASLLPILGSTPRPMFLSMVGGIFAIGFTVTLAIMLGVSMIGRDLSEKRLSFYFAKPLSASSLWFGKLLASALLIAGCFVVMIVPVALSNREWNASWNVNLVALTGFLAGTAIVLFLGSHVASTMLRSRSAIIALDALLAAAAVTIAVVLVRRLYLQGAVDLSFRLAGGIAAGGALVALIGGAWQLERGRADRLRNHIELSKFVWPGAAIVLVLAAAFAMWVTSATPASLREYVTVRQSSTGDWAFIEGPTTRHHYRGKFLVNVKSGEWYPFRPGADFHLSAAFSGDGHHAVYLGEGPDSPSRSELYTLSLDGTAKPQPVDTGMSFSNRAGDLVLSDDGSRLALFEYPNLSVIDLKTKRTVAACQPPLGYSTMFFASNDLIRYYLAAAEGRPTRARTLRIFEFDAAHRALRETTAGRISALMIFPTVSADGSTMLVRAHDGDDKNARLILADARTGIVAETIPVAHRADLFSSTLIGNRVAYVTHDANGHGLLRIGNGAPIDLGAVATANVLGEVRPGTVVVVGSTSTGKDRQVFSLVVDTARGTVERRATYPPFEFGIYMDADPRVPRGFVSPELLRGRKDVVLRWNAETGEVKKMF